jgi:type II secretory pathway component GspD/PulD (secretin)
VLNFKLFAIDLVDNSFIDFVRFVSNSTGKNFIVDEDIDTRISVILPHDFNNLDSYKVLKSVVSKKNMFIVKIGSTYYIKKIKKKKPPIKQFFSKKLLFLLPKNIIPIIKKYYPNVKITKSKKTVIYMCTKQEEKSISKLITMLDKPNKSKKVKITLISYNDSDLYEYGLSLDASVKNGLNSIQYKTFLQNLVSSSSLVLNLQNIDISAFITDLKTKELIDSKFSPTLTLSDGKSTEFSITQKIPFLNGSTSINGSNDVKEDTYSYNDVGSSVYLDNVTITDDELYFHIKMQYEIILEKSLTPTTSKRSIDNYLKL